MKYISYFREHYEKPWRKIEYNSPEIRLMNALCEENKDEVKRLFCDEKLFGGKSGIYAPHGYFGGTAEIQEFAKIWLNSFEATAAHAHPIVQTRANGRSVTEFTVCFERDKGNLEIPIAVVGDLRPDEKLDEARIYFFYKWVDGFKAFRPYIFESTSDRAADFSLMTGAPKEYFKALHTEGGLDRIVEISSDDITYGGYRPECIEEIRVGKEKLREMYVNTCAEAPSQYRVRAQVIIDNGITCAVEWNLMITDAGRKTGFIPMAGIAFYERGKDGKLSAIRICDDNGYYNDIDYEKYPELKMPYQVKENN